MTSRIAASTVTAAALAAPAVAAAAPVLAPLAPCYVVASPAPADRQGVEVSGSGFTPGALVDVHVDGRFEATVTTDAEGALLPGSVPAPYVDGPNRPFTVTATERGTGAGASATADVTRLAVSVRPRTVAPATRVRFAGSGFTAARPVYAHYLRRGVERRRVRISAAPITRCGAFAARRRLFPFSPAAGRWTIQFDQQRRYERRPATVFLRLSVDVSQA